MPKSPEEALPDTIRSSEQASDRMKSEAHGAQQPECTGVVHEDSEHRATKLFADMGTCAELLIVVQVAFPSTHPTQAKLHTLTLPVASSVADALAAFRAAYPADSAQISACTTAIYGVPVDECAILQAFDRLELLPPLRCDPKEARRQRFSKHQPMRDNNP